MQPIRFILIGAGDRGTSYVKLGKQRFGDAFLLVGVADPDPIRRNYIKKEFGLSDSQCYTCWTEILGVEKMADIAIIATQDNMHFSPAMKAISMGYHLLLEKPAATTPEQCMEIQDAAHKANVCVLVCHVLRFSPFFRLLKRLIDEGAIGKVINIVHVEAVGNIHQSHSYVRGDWRDSHSSSPMIVAKCCHDVDIVQWLLGKKCVSVQSFGSLSYFNRENLPPNAPTFCTDGCPYETECPYSTLKIYKKRAFPAFVKTATSIPNATDEDIAYTITQTGYGRCVFQCDNNVVDHQVVNLLYDGGETVSLTMSAFNEGGREIRIMGTKGELSGYMRENCVTLFDFATRSKKTISIQEDVPAEGIEGGHGGGDLGIVEFLCRNFADGNLPDVSEAIENHLVAFAAEKSRCTGEVVHMKDFMEKQSVGLKM